MTRTRLTVLAFGAALAGWIGGAAAQQPLTPQQKLEAQQKKAQAQPPTPQRPLTPQQKLEAEQKKLQAQQAARYDEYEASRRFPTKRGGCQEGNEQLLGSFCVRVCKAGYAATDDAKSGVRQCRSQKPLPAGQVPVANQKETSKQPPAKPSSSRPGV